MKTLTVTLLALALCGCGDPFAVPECKGLTPNDCAEYLKAREKTKETYASHHGAYLQGWIDGHDNRPPTPDAPNSQIGEPDRPSPKAGEGK